MVKPMRTPMATIPQSRTRRLKRVSLISIKQQPGPKGRAFFFYRPYPEELVKQVSKDGHNVWTRGDPSRRARGRAPQDKVGEIFRNRLVLSFRGDAQRRTRNLEIPRCAIAHLRSGSSVHLEMTAVKGIQSTTIFTRSRTLTWAWASSPFRMRKRSAGRSTAAMRCASDSTVSPGCAVMTFIRSGRAA